MSWQSYVDEMIIKEIDCKYAIIAGLTDGQVWASYTKAELAQVSQTELKVIADALKTNPNSFLEKGIHFGSDKYVCLSVEDSVLLGRKGLVCAVGDDKCAPGKLNTVVGKKSELTC
ncbi:unnamed protein product [Oppiella nova]|uniref:Profilin n=1 Tax=Oppiella nova TaxID=334625 RepID=A0A7R9QPF6_9ACAR|nr:unnamed protein product [Oppiella nova]CAG2168982.1 unnamed protein product [Oppiella nova]